ncbi:hypothetical protein PR202_ga06528 [Eleusine coracana subsp. coracana]|uniref:Uncharacterized protein n=1 Tax=Eleusine coracana subsp. coracana TaxID=191504 RepID=A0AAV5BW62_ELECO|nr:hypothetical protein PR202_ga06528 [Eleusine coracana subsp. coracana]
MIHLNPTRRIAIEAAAVEPQGQGYASTDSLGSPEQQVHHLGRLAVGVASGAAAHRLPRRRLRAPPAADAVSCSCCAASRASARSVASSHLLSLPAVLMAHSRDRIGLARTVPWLGLPLVVSGSRFGPCVSFSPEQPDKRYRRVADLLHAGEMPVWIPFPRTVIQSHRF